MRKIEKMQTLIKKIERLKKEGFEIHLPGGKGKDGSNAVTVAIVGRFIPTNECVVVVIPYRIRPFAEHIKRKKRKHRRVEQPETIAIREIREETKIHLTKEKVFIVHDKIEADNRPGHGHRLHHKYSLIAEHYMANKMRRVLTQGEPNLGVPFLMPFSMLREHLCGGQKWALGHLSIYIQHRLQHFPPVGLNTGTFHNELVRELIRTVQP